MSDVPFGFGPPSDEGDDESKRRQGDQPAGQGGDPFAGLFGGLLGGSGGGDLGAALQQLGRMLSYEGGPVNWDLARDVARRAEPVTDDRFVGQAERGAVEEAVRLAELWLDPVTTLPAGTTGAVAYSRAEWVEATLPVWRQLVEPVASSVNDALGEVMGGGLAGLPGLPEEMREQMRAQAEMLRGPLSQMMRQMGGALYGMQLGQALGALAGEVVSSTDVGVPLVASGRAVLVPANVRVFGEGLGLPDSDVRLFLALRECAHQRLYAHVPWLRQHLLGIVASYARGIKVDTSRLEEAMGQLDPTDPESIQQALSGGLFEPRNTPEQEAALARLETALALVEGWVDEVTANAAGQVGLASTGALRETLRRRRAIGGPAEQTFATLVGLELRPRRLRDAATLWHLLTEERGIEGRDALWRHPDLLPTTADLDDPAAYVHGSGLDSGLDLSELEGLEPPDDGSAAGSGPDDGSAPGPGPRDPDQPPE